MGEVPLMVALDGVRDEGQADLVVIAVPAFAGVVGAEGDGLVDFGVGVGLVLALVPAETAEDAGVFARARARR